jgi:hypothetical protein
LAFAWSRDEADSKRIEEKADKKTMAWIFRNFRSECLDILASLKAAKKRHEEMGMSAVAVYQNMTIAKGSDGTFSLANPENINDIDTKNDQGKIVACSMVGFGEFCFVLFYPMSTFNSTTCY